MPFFNNQINNTYQSKLDMNVASPLLWVMEFQYEVKADQHRWRNEFVHKPNYNLCMEECLTTLKIYMIKTLHL